MIIKKSLGQNFLIDNNIIKKIVEIGKINSNNVVLEIGPGTGNLTSEILKKNPKKLIVVEKDKDLAEKLGYKFNKTNKLSILNSDALKIRERNYINENVVVFGNLPYNISTQLLAKWILIKKWPPWYKVLILMFQKEVAERILAKNKSENYSRLSVLSNWRLKIKKHFKVSKNCFFPKPKVDSMVLSFLPIKNFQYKIKDPKNLERITRIFFSNRRKMINKPFKKIFKNKKLPDKNFYLNLKLRPDDLDINTYYKLAIFYENLFD